MSDSNILLKIDESKEISAAVYSIIGHREYQQDFAGLIKNYDKVLAVVCDGMGGLAGGELASCEATHLLLNDYQKEQPASHYTEFLCREAEKMDMAVHKLKTEKGEPLNAGSTVVSVILSKGELHWMSVGDSRVYVLRGDSMAQITRDHNYRRELEDGLACGEISLERFQAESATKRAEALTSYLGMGGLKWIEHNGKSFNLEDGDIILLCSDGLYKSLDEHQIQAMILDNEVNMQIAAKRLVRMALDKAVKSQDNTTVILLQYHKPQEKEV